MNSNRFSNLFRVTICALILGAILPAAALGQRRWVRSDRSRVVIYNYRPRPYVVYPRRSYRTYRTYNYGYQPYYGTRYSSGYYQPDYATRSYSYRYSQTYFANRYTYAGANQAYRYEYNRYRSRPRHNGFRIGIRLR